MAERRLPAGNLPADLTSFVGRGEELSHVRQLLSQSRLVTLTGVGGVGKSRLALRTAQQQSRAFPDGAFLVELASLRDPALLPQAVGQALGLADPDGGGPLEALCCLLAPLRLLLVADNCEHMIPACQQVLTALLQAAPGLRVIATSREVLRIPGEQVCEVEPLRVPKPGASADPDVIAAYPGVALFMRRAEEVRPVFTVTSGNADAVAQVCGLSEGLPLFLELAAPQLRSLSVEQLAGRLDDRFHLLARRSSAVLPRHQSLRAAVQWSYTLCGEAERLLWVRASVFAGRFDLEAAEGVCAGAGLPAGAVLDALTGLIDKSVLVSAECDGVRRYWMLDTLRAFGLDRLRNPEADDRQAGGEVELRRRHRDYYLGLAARFSAEWFGPRQLAWSRRLRAELPELRAALAFCLDTPGEAAAGLRLAGVLDCFWYGCGATREGRLWLDRALAADPAPSVDRVRALIVYGRVLVSSGLHTEAAEPARECLELARRIGDPALLAEALSVRGLNLVYSGDPAAAVSLLDESIELAAALPDAPFALALATAFRGVAATAAGEVALADRLMARWRAICRAAGDRWLLNHALGLSIPVALMLGDVSRASAYGRESLSGCATLGDTVGLTVSLELLAWTAAAEGDHRRAARLLGASARQAGVNGGSPFTSGQYQATRHQRECAARGALGDVVFCAEFGTGADLTLEEAIAYALDDSPRLKPRRPETEPPAADGTPELTRREFEIARLLAEGLTNKQVADKLVISRRTAEGHVEHILAKLGFTTRTQIASWILARPKSHDRTA